MGDALYPKEKYLFQILNVFSSNKIAIVSDKYYDSVQSINLNHHFHDRIDLRSNSMCLNLVFMFSSTLMDQNIVSSNHIEKALIVKN